MIVTYIGSTNTQLINNIEYEVIAKDLQVFKAFYKLKDIEGWWPSEHFSEKAEEKEDPEPFSEF